MYQVHATMLIFADSSVVFEALSDHECFLTSPDLTCRLLQQGHEQKHGLGAIREVTREGAIFTEEITAFQPPEYYEYVIRSFVNLKGRPNPLHHERGWVDFTSENGATRVDWYSRFEIPFPVVGPIAELIAGFRVQRAFVKLLRLAKGELETNHVRIPQPHIER